MAKKNGSNLDEIREVVEFLSEMMRQHDLVELSYEKEGFKISARRAEAAPTIVPATAAVSPTTAAQTAQQPKQPEPEEGAEYITAPMPGTFYRAPAPGAEPFVKEGDIVNGKTENYEGDTLCVIEAMKVMNEIKPEFNCQILEILVENGARVEYGQRLFKVKRN